MSEPDPFRSLYPDQPNIQKLYATVGEPAVQTGNPNNLGGAVQWASDSTAPYKGRSKMLCMAKGDTCKGTRAKGTEYCIGHLRSFGMIENDQRAPRHPKEPG